MGQTKYLIAAILVLMTALAGALYGLKAQHTTLTNMKVSLDGEKSLRIEAEARTARIQVQVGAEKARADANRSLLRNALKENAEWARGAVPASVADSLCHKPAVCSPAASTVR